MHTTVTTVITTRIDLDTMEPDHSVEIQTEDSLPIGVVYAAVEGACASTLKTLSDQKHATTPTPISDTEY